MKLLKKFQIYCMLVALVAAGLVGCSKEESASLSGANNQSSVQLKATDAVVTDVDGNVYTTVVIGTQTWMVENLKTTHYRNGDAIANVTVGTSWAGLTTGAYCWYNNDVANKSTYGALYNKYAATDSRNIAPVGWHVPTDAEIATLTAYLGGVSVAGGKMKETGTTHWLTPNTGATNSSGFKAVPGGRRIYTGTFGSINDRNYIWSTTSVGNNTWGINLHSSDAIVTRDCPNNKEGMSIRCIKDPVVLPTVSVAAATNITTTSASVTGNVTSDGGNTVTERGICWAQYNQTPSTTDNKIVNGSGLGSFTTSISGLTANTTYYVRAYATSSAGTAYSSTISFTTVAATHSLGDFYQGGYIFYLDATGEHGLISSEDYVGTSEEWTVEPLNTYIVTGATASAIGTGLANTNTILSVQGAGAYAAQLCADYSAYGYSDWYLPSAMELREIFKKLQETRIHQYGMSADGTKVWSSTEVSGTTAQTVTFGLYSDGTPGTYDKANFYSVIAVRAF